MNPPDPEDLRRSEHPAVVVKADGQSVFVARANVEQSGWVSFREWDGGKAKLPPQQIEAIRYLDREPHGERRSDGSRPLRIADPDWRAQAQAQAQVDDQDISTPEVSADD
jgi:hypothetical protein